MPGSIHRDEVRRLMDRGATVVEILAPDEYEEDPAEPVVVYCWDSA
jgi:hypothetical protein